MSRATTSDSDLTWLVAAEEKLEAMADVEALVANEGLSREALVKRLAARLAARYAKGGAASAPISASALPKSLPQTFGLSKLQVRVLQAVREAGRDMTYAEVHEALVAHGWAKATGEPSKAVWAPIKALAEQGLLVRVGPKPFKVRATAEGGPEP